MDLSKRRRCVEDGSTATYTTTHEHMEGLWT
jgi:hypothetical protein